jgi:YD repeat-containing protein
MHTATFDTGTRQWTDTSTSRTSVRSYPSVAAFVDEGQFLEPQNGATQQVVTAGAGTTTFTYTYDSQGRLAAATMTIMTPQTNFTAREETYTAWDNRGRPTGGTANMFPPLPGEGCTGKTIVFSYDDGTRVADHSYTGGTSMSANMTDWCTNTNQSSQATYDARFITSQVVNVTTVTSTETWTVMSTGQVCR